VTDKHQKPRPSKPWSQRELTSRNECLPHEGRTLVHPRNFELLPNIKLKPIRFCILALVARSQVHFDFVLACWKGFNDCMVLRVTGHGVARVDNYPRLSIGSYRRNQVGNVADFQVSVPISFPGPTTRINTLEFVNVILPVVSLSGSYAPHRGCLPQCARLIGKR